MNPPAVQLLAALLSLGTIVATIAVVAAAVLARRGTVTEFFEAVVSLRSPLIAVISGGAMLGSLYFSEVAHYIPCTLCWYQRIPMYSLAIVAVVATLRRECPVTTFVTLAAVGAPISLYHWLLERFPDLDAGACSATVPCTLVWFEKFGFVTLPFMALTAFVAVLAIATAPLVAARGRIAESP